VPKNRFAKFLTLGLTLLTLSACGGNNNNNTAAGGPTKGDRILEIDVTAAADGDFATAFDTALAAGMESISLSVDWNQIDIGTDSSVFPPVPIYETDPNQDFPAIANFCYPKTGTGITFTLRPIITLVKNVPAGFESTPFNDQGLIDRFKALIDHVFTKIPDLEINTLAIGSEVDLYLNTTQLRTEYLEFYKQVSAYARIAYAAQYPGKKPLKISVEVTHAGLLDATTAAYYQSLNAFSDVVAISYYPLQSGLVQNPTIIHSDIQTLETLYPDKEIFFLQLGYPSGYYSTEAFPEFLNGTVTPVIASSDVMQSQFIAEVFKAWDKSKQIKLIDFTWLAIAAEPAFGGSVSPAPEFVEFLRTLGLRTNSGLNGTPLTGTDKPALTTLKKKAVARGWLPKPGTFCQ